MPRFLPSHTWPHRILAQHLPLSLFRTGGHRRGPLRTSLRGGSRRQWVPPLAPLVALVLFGLTPLQAVPLAEEQIREDEKALQEAGIPTEATKLLEFFRNRAVNANDKALKQWVRQLGADNFFDRQQASRRLIAAGARAKPFLREALKSKDAEVARRARICLREIQRGAAEVSLGAAIRVLALKKPTGTVQALVDYLPAAEPAVAADIRQALIRLATLKGKPHPVLVKALSDEVPSRRRAAGVALGGVKEVYPQVRKLLADSNLEVRLHVGLALARAGHKDVVPELVALLESPDVSQIGLLEQFLYRLAGANAPRVLPGESPAARKRYRQAWEGWWRAHGTKLTAAQIVRATRTLGYTVVVLLDRNQIIELDATNRERWRLDGLQFPLDVEMLPNNNVLLAEHGGNKVTERTTKGKVVWEKKISEPLVAQRLPNGNTFIASKYSLVEVDPKGKEVFTYRRPDGGYIMRAKKLRNGDIALVTMLGVPRFVRLNSKGKELKSFGVNVNTSGGRIDVLPNGHVLIPEMLNNRVAEYNADGKLVGQITVQQPIVARRLPNGNTLVTSMNQNRAVELTPKGKEVWQYRSTESRVTRAVRR